MRKTVQRLKEAKSLFFEKIKKIDKYLSKWSRRKWEKIQINKLRNEKESAAIDPEEIQKTIGQTKNHIPLNEKI